MTRTESNSSDTVVVAYAVEIAIPVTEVGGPDTDFPQYGGEIVRDAIAGWGVTVTRIVHLSDPDSVFPDA